MQHFQSKWSSSFSQDQNDLKCCIFKVIFDLKLDLFFAFAFMVQGRTQVLSTAGICEDFAILSRIKYQRFSRHHVHVGRAIVVSIHGFRSVHEAKHLLVGIRSFIKLLELQASKISDRLR